MAVLLFLVALLWLHDLQVFLNPRTQVIYKETLTKDLVKFDRVSTTAIVPLLSDLSFRDFCLVRGDGRDGSLLPFTNLRSTLLSELRQCALLCMSEKYSLNDTPDCACRARGGMSKIDAALVHTCQL